MPFEIKKLIDDPNGRYKKFDEIYNSFDTMPSWTDGRTEILY